MIKKCLQKLFNYLSKSILKVKIAICPKMKTLVGIHSYCLSGSPFSCIWWPSIVIVLKYLRTCMRLTHVNIYVCSLSKLTFELTARTNPCPPFPDAICCLRWRVALLILRYRKSNMTLLHKELRGWWLNQSGYIFTIQFLCSGFLPIFYQRIKHG